MITLPPTLGLLVMFFSYMSTLNVYSRCLHIRLVTAGADACGTRGSRARPCRAAHARQRGTAGGCTGRMRAAAADPRAHLLHTVGA